MNWKWPETPSNDYFPWYWILWHGIWILPINIIRIVFVILVTISSLSLDMGDRAWQDTR